MSAIFTHELRSYFHSLTAWVFAAFLLCFVGIGAMLYNIQAAVSNFEYVLSLSSLAFVVIAPILAMRVLAEERRQKTDQLLYALPVSTTEVVLGKYAALVVLYLVNEDPMDVYEATLDDFLRDDNIPVFAEVESVAFSGAEDQTIQRDENGDSYREEDDYYLDGRPLDTDKLDSYLSHLSSMGLSSYATYKAAE